MDGAQDPGKYIVNPDNICVDRQLRVRAGRRRPVLSQQRPRRAHLPVHAIASPGQRAKPMLEMDHRRGEATFNAKYITANENRLSSLGVRGHVRRE
ncbi:MAG: hypothetical protein WKG07_06885 [Hymenobacter sp.]